MHNSHFFSVGFRAFFAGGIGFAAIAFAIWGYFWFSLGNGESDQFLKPFGGMLFWHPHELIMGFALAIIMGFLLTAVRNWTGLETAPPLGLLLLWLLWVLARLTMLFSQHIPFSVLLISQIMVPLLAGFYIAQPILMKKMWRNLFAPILLLAFALLDATLLYQVQFNGSLVSPLLQSGVLLIVLMISIIAGRVIPFFMANKLNIAKIAESKLSLFSSTLPIFILIALTMLGEQPSLLLFMTASVLSVANLYRLWLWHHRGIWQHPMLWSLWLFYGAIPVGFACKAVAVFAPQFNSIALHTFAVGAICGLILSMVSRVSLGHTGRIIIHDKAILAVFALLLASFTVRIISVSVLGASTALFALSAGLIAIAFAVLFVRFIGIWMRARL